MTQAHKAFEKHNHAQCQKTALRHVEARARAEGLRLTDMRKRVLSILLESHQALGAYDILNRLVSEGEPAQPPIVYRALSFLTEHDFVHKVECENAYMACQFPQRAHHAALLICRECKSVGEQALAEPLMEDGEFLVETQTLEARGLCPQCREDEASEAINPEDKHVAH